MTIPAVARVESLTVDIATSARRRSPRVRVLHDVCLALWPGAVTVLAGESGCGKSMVAAALCGLLPPGSSATGEVVIDGRSLRPGDPAWERLRGTTVGLVPQSPSTSFTPVRTVGSQLDEVVRVLGGPRPAAQLCDLVELPRAALDRYPHELSGGMAQRAAIAAAVAGAPRVLLADEPTSALDPELAHTVWELFAGLARSGTAVLAITHDLPSLRRARIDATIAVMRGGRVLSERPAAEFLDSGGFVVSRRVIAAPGPPEVGTVGPRTLDPGTVDTRTLDTRTVDDGTLDDGAYLDAFFSEVL